MFNPSVFVENLGLPGGNNGGEPKSLPPTYPDLQFYASGGNSGGNSEAQMVYQTRPFTFRLGYPRPTSH